MLNHLKFLPLFSLIALISTADVYGITFGHSTDLSFVGTVGPSNLSLFTRSIVNVDPSGTVFSENHDRGSVKGGACSGTLIAPRIVLTAAHCFDDKTTLIGDNRSIFHLYEQNPDVRIFNNTTMLGYPPMRAVSSLDETPLRKTESIEGTFFVHPEYFVEPNDYGTINNTSHDIAVLILDTQPIGVTPALISLNATLPKVGDKLDIYGYGRTGIACFEGRQGLRQVMLPILEVSPDGKIILIDEMEGISVSSGNESSGGSGGTLSIPKTEFAPSPFRNGSCQGDSGGPAFNDNDEIVAIITSSEHPVNNIEGEFLAPNHKTTLTSVANNIDWILSKSESFIMNGGGLCLDAHRPDIHKNGAKIQIWKCVSGAINQWWSLNKHRQVVNAGGKCLDVHRPDFVDKVSEAKVQLWKCVDAAPNQKWLFKNGNLVSDNGMCLDLNPSEMLNNGSRVQLWECEDSTMNQHWYHY